MKRQQLVFSLSIDTLRQMPDALSIPGLTTVDNSVSPYIACQTDDWRGVPVQLDSIFIIFGTSGKLSVRIGFNEYTIEKDCVCVAIPGTIVEVLSVTPDFHCMTMVMAGDFISLGQQNTLQMMKMFKFVQRQSCYSLTGEYAKRYHETFVEAIKTMQWTENPLRPQMMQEYVFLLTCCLYPVLEATDKDFQQKKSLTHQAEIYFRFIELVQTHYHEHHTVAYYAEQLEITPKYLSKIVCAESGQNALKWIENFIVLEAKALLKQKEIKIQTISERLCFPDQTCFWKFFHRAVGLSPKEYREKSN